MFRADVTSELAELERRLSSSRAASSLGPATILTNSHTLRPLGLSLMLKLLQQFSGIKVINSYIVQIFQNAGSKVRGWLSPV